MMRKTDLMQYKPEQIGLIPEKFRDAVQLLALGKSYDEIAATLGLPKGTVKSRINRGRIALRFLFDRYPTGKPKWNREGKPLDEHGNPISMKSFDHAQSF